MTQLKTQLDKPSLATLTSLQSEISVQGKYSGSPLIASIQTFVLPSAVTFKGGFLLLIVLYTIMLQVQPYQDLQLILSWSMQS